MWNQKNLFGEKLPMSKDDPQRPPEDACTERCFDALEEKCTCRCGGAYHGLGRLNIRSEHEEKVKESEKECLK